MKSVAVTGIAGYLGKRLLKLLDGDPEITRIVGFDVKPLEATSEKLTFFQKDINDPLKEIFRDLAYLPQWVIQWKLPGSLGGWAGMWR